MLVIVAVVFIWYSVVSGSTDNDATPTVLYVTPNPNIPCPGVPCLTLYQYSRDQRACFKSDTELHFLSGVHRLSSPIVIEGGTNITKLALLGVGERQSKLISSTAAGQGSLKMIGINSTRIKSLHFRGINILTVVDSLSLIASDLHFTAMNGSAFSFESIDNITGTNITIANSSAAVYSAGAIRLSNVVFFDMIVKNNSGNSIVIIEESFVQFKGISIFANNSANRGSTLVIHGSTVTFDKFTLFQLNRCQNKGGAMNIINSNVTFTDDTKLSSNSAQDGGAIQLDHSALKMKGSIDISNNWVTKRFFNGKVFGGAISSIESSIIMIGNVTFRGNHIYANFLMGLGGAISAQESWITLSGIIGFNHNYIRSLLNFGGAILLSNSTFVASNITLTFTNNKAKNGGAIAITGLLNPLPSIVKVEGTSLFDANVAGVSGGALFGTNFMYIEFVGNTILSRNVGKDPGSNQIAIGQTSMAEVQFSGNTEIKDSVGGGATVSFQGNVRALFNGTTKFINNTGL